MIIHADWLTLAIALVAAAAIGATWYRNTRAMHALNNVLMRKLNTERVEAKNEKVRAENAYDASVANLRGLMGSEITSLRQIMELSAESVVHRAELTSDRPEGQRALLALYGLHLAGLWEPTDKQQRLFSKARATAKGQPDLEKMADANSAAAKAR